MNFPLVSILIPVFNQETYILDCLNSLIQDDYPCKEIIILDDGSTDRSAEIIRAWLTQQDPQQKIIFFSQTNQGICATLNHMIEKASGEYIRPLSGDDRLIPGMLKQHLVFLEKCPEKKVAFADARVIDQEGNVTSDSVLTRYISHQKKDLVSDKALRRLIVLHGKIIPNLLIRKSFYQQFKYPVEFKMEDYYFFLVLAAKNQLIFFDAAVGDYRTHKKNASWRFSWREPAIRTRQRLAFIHSEVASLSRVERQFHGSDKVWILYAKLKKLAKIFVLRMLLLAASLRA